MDSPFWCPRESIGRLVHRVIYEELVLGEIRPESRREFARISDDLPDPGPRG